jgi:hypothetical protein
MNNPLTSVDPTGLCDPTIQICVYSFEPFCNGVNTDAPECIPVTEQPWLTTTNFACLFWGGCGGNSPNPPAKNTGNSGNTSGGAANNGPQQPQISPQAQACVNQANQQIQNQLQTFSGYAGTKLLGRALIGGGLGAMRGFYKAAQTDSPWIIASSAVVGAAIGVGWNILSDTNTIRNIQNSFMNKFVACMQNASVPKPPE